MASEGLTQCPFAKLCLAGAALYASSVAIRSLRDLFLEKKQDPLWESCCLTSKEVERFGRQVVLAKLGAEGQKKLLTASVLVVGAGGLGCPVALYLSAGGIGKLGIVDNDEVAVSNLHRQVAHFARSVGMNKAESLKQTCQAVNSMCDIAVHPFRLTDVQQAVELILQYDVVVDCTDAPPSRQLLNEACIKAKRPLVAPSAVGLSGQLTVYNHDDGPCLRCAFPAMPRGYHEEAPLASCEENGVMGPIPGILGTLAALETMKLLAGGALAKTCFVGRMLLYDSMDPSMPCRTMKLKRRPECDICGSGAVPTPDPTDAKTATKSCSSCAPALQPGAPGEEISAPELARKLRDREGSVLLLDVRAPTHFSVAHLTSSSNWPLAEMWRTDLEAIKERFASELKTCEEADPSSAPLVVTICRRGNDSLRAVRRLKEAGVEAVSLAGGLQAFSRESPAPLVAPRIT